MKLCDKCKYANWDRTVSGKLHPNKQGRCAFPWKMPPLPQAFYFAGTMSRPLVPSGGFIRRGLELHDHCAYYTRADK